MTRLLFALPLLALPSACADPTPPPAADPVKVERLVASLEKGPAMPPAIEKKLRSADRISGALTKVEPTKIDPNVAVALISR